MTAPDEPPPTDRALAAPEPGERRRLDRPPGERYVRERVEADARPASLADRLLVPIALVLGTALAFTLLGGLLTVTAGLIVLAGFAGWLTGRLVGPPGLATAVALVAVVAGFLGIWLFGRIEGGVLDPVTYLFDVEGPVVVVLSLLLGGGLAAAASR